VKGSKNTDKDKLPTYPESYWLDKLEIPQFNQLNEDLKVDVVIVGGGITGITTAYLLEKEGLKVALLEAGKLLNGTTGHTTAKITAQHDVIYDEFINHLGRNKARLYYEASIEAKRFIEKTINEHNINCDFSKQDAYLYATTEQSARKLEKEFEAYQTLKIDGELTNEIPFDIEVQKVLSMKDQAQFHPLSYLTHLVQIIKEGGGLLFEDTTAVNVEETNQGVKVLTRNGSNVSADYVVAASHFPFYEGTGLYSTRMYADRSYVLAVKTKKEYPGGMYLNIDQPSRSLRSVTINGENAVLVSGESHKTGQGKDTLEHYKALETFSQEVLGSSEILYRWSTQDLTTLDKVPYVGAITASQPNILIATGYRKWGMTNGTVAAQLLRDIIIKKESPYQELYSPSRFYADPSLRVFFRENFDVVKHLVKGKLEVGEQEVKDLSNDEGAVVSIDGKRKGAYKDHEGKLHIVDTTCTHIGCEVNWNHGDRTWDCPCHGSRFSYTGEVIEGPAEKPLQREEHTMLENLTSEDSGY
jgi:glycine/D-amino acid oxidase-like deaminating enzyme/nitrite reductase/ring-hydroxylating ferredoxin subunit